MSDSQDFRIEHDSMGDVRVPSTPNGAPKRSGPSRTFRSPGLVIDRELIGALAAIKGAAATVNAELGVIDQPIAAGDRATPLPK